MAKFWRLLSSSNVSRPGVGRLCPATLTKAAVTGVSSTHHVVLGVSVGGSRCWAGRVLQSQLTFVPPLNFNAVPVLQGEFPSSQLKEIVIRYTSWLVSSNHRQLIVLILFPNTDVFSFEKVTFPLMIILATVCTVLLAKPCFKLHSYIK